MHPMERSAMLGRRKQSRLLFANGTRPGVLQPRRGPRPHRRSAPRVEEGGRLAPITSDASVSDGAVRALTASSSALPTLPETSGALLKSSSDVAWRGGSQLTVAGPMPTTHAVTEVDVRRVTMWPATQQVGKLKPHVTKNSKAPLALQLEAFIRKEHRQYLLENPDCSRADTLHIFREAFTVAVDHFTEYKSVLNLIRDEYDAALDEMSEQMKRMRVSDLENRSDRSLHAMELIHIKESLNATISNQQAQLKATQGLLHSLREQLAAAEHVNTLLKCEMERRFKEHEDAKEQVKLLSRAMIEESARTALVMEDSRKKEKEVELLNARLRVAKENIEELETCLRAQTERQRRLSSGSDGLFAGDSARVARHVDEQALWRANRAFSDSDTAAVAAPAASVGHCSYNDEYVIGLLVKVDQLQFALASSKAAAAPLADDSAHKLSLFPEDDTAGAAPDTAPPTVAAAVHAKQPNRTVVRMVRPVQLELPVLREWLRQEAITEADVEETDCLLPPGIWPTEELAFLKACMPVANRHLTLTDVLHILGEFWTARERATDFSRLSDYFLSWLTARTGGGAGLKELGVNLLQTCQRNSHHPECRAILLLLRGFLPEQLVLSWRQGLDQLEKACEAAAVAHGVEGTITADEFLAIVRTAFPGKPRAHFLQLRFFAQRAGGGADAVDWKALLAKGSYLVTLLKSQLLREVEEFTLRAVEGVRAAGDSVKNTVPVAKVLEVLRALDRGMGNELLFRYVADASQKTIMEVANADAGAPSSANLETLLLRFRTVVLLQRTSPEG